MSTAASSSSMEQMEFQVGLPVTLKDLSVAHLNGRSGMLVEDVNERGRFTVMLDGPYKSPSTGQLTRATMTIKPENLCISRKTGCCQGCMLTFDIKQLDKCSRCRLARYCSRRCQKDHWKAVHKEDCELLRTARKSTKDDTLLPTDRKDRVFALMERAGRRMNRGDAVGAEADYRRLIEEEGFGALGAYCNLGVAIIMQGQPANAIPYLRIAVTLEPVEGPMELNTAYQMLANAYGMTQNKVAQKETLREALQKFPGDPQLQAMLQAAG